MGNGSGGMQDRRALYYPWIHFRDMEWLKGTLLAFGRVHRIVPFDHDLAKDPPEVRAISERHNAPLPVVLEVDPERNAIEQAQGVLHAALSTLSRPELDRRFGQGETLAREAKTKKRFEIHRGKVNDDLFRQLEQRNLIWPADRTDVSNPWLWLHPDLGEAIMSVSAIASARETGSDVVTDDVELHGALAALDEKTVLSDLLATGSRPPPLPVDQAADQLAHVVMTTRLDLSGVPLEEIADLARDGHDLRKFREHLRTLAEELPPDLAQDYREKRLDDLADRVVTSWEEFDKGLPKRLKMAVTNSVSGAGEEIAKEMTKTAVATLLATGAVGAAAVFAAPVVVPVLASASVPVLFQVVKTWFAWRRRADHDGPWRYLSRIRKAGGVQLSVPRPYRSQRPSV